jgi:hypothetical protein
MVRYVSRIESVLLAGHWMTGTERNRGTICRGQSILMVKLGLARIGSELALWSSSHGVEPQLPLSMDPVRHACCGCAWPGCALHILWQLCCAQLAPATSAPWWSPMPGGEKGARPVLGKKWKRNKAGNRVGWPPGHPGTGPDPDTAPVSRVRITSHTFHLVFNQRRCLKTVAPVHPEVSSGLRRRHMNHSCKQHMIYF